MFYNQQNERIDELQLEIAWLESYVGTLEHYIFNSIGDIIRELNNYPNPIHGLYLSEYAKKLENIKPQIDKLKAYKVDFMKAIGKEI